MGIWVLGSNGYEKDTKGVLVAWLGLTLGLKEKLGGHMGMARGIIR